MLKLGLNPMSFFSYDRDTGLPIQITPKVVALGSKPTNYDLQMSDHWDPVTDLSILRDWDLVYIKIPELKETPSLKAASNISIGDEAYSIGYPLKFSDDFPLPSFGYGNISFVHENHIEGDFLFLVGMSGGPILNKSGQLT